MHVETDDVQHVVVLGLLALGRKTPFQCPPPHPRADFVGLTGETLEEEKHHQECEGSAEF